MEQHYTCPHCDGHLKIGNSLIFMVKNSKKVKGLIRLDPEIGNYSSLKHPTFEIEPGELIEFYCPLCHAHLGADFDEHLGHVILHEDDKYYDVYFSRIAGEESTYKVFDEEVTATGDHADRYTYFKMSDKLKQFVKR